MHAYYFFKKLILVRGTRQVCQIKKRFGGMNYLIVRLVSTVDLPD